MQYKVYSDSSLIFDSNRNDKQRQIFGACVDLELNKTGSFSFTIYPSHPAFDVLQKMKSIITVYQDDYLIFRGRILNDEQGWYNEKQVTCEGELAFLLDSIQRPYDFMSGDKHTTITDLFSFFIANHNLQIEDEEKQFYVGNITVTDPNNYIVRSDSTYMNTWDSINKKLIETYGGYLWVRHEANGNYIDYLTDFSTLGSQSIKFGKNLLDISKIVKGEDIYTALIPLGAKISGESEERVTITSLPDDTESDVIRKSGDMIYSVDAVNKYGYIFRSKMWDDVNEAPNLLRKAKAELTDGINLEFSVELTAADLAGINQNISGFHLGTYISVDSDPHSLDGNFLVKKLSISLLNPSSNRLTVGTTYKSLTEQNTGIKNDIESTNSYTELVKQNMERNYYTKTDTDAVIVKKIEDNSKDYYSKTQTDNLLSAYYKKTVVDELLKSYITVSTFNSVIDEQILTIETAQTVPGNITDVSELDSLAVTDRINNGNANVYIRAKSDTVEYVFHYDSKTADSEAEKYYFKCSDYTIQLSLINGSFSWLFL